MKYKITYNNATLETAGGKVFGFWIRSLLVRFKRWGTSYNYSLQFFLRINIQRQHPQTTIALPVAINVVLYNDTGYKRAEVTLQFLIFELKIEFRNHRIKVELMSK